MQLRPKGEGVCRAFSDGRARPADCLLFSLHAADQPDIGRDSGTCDSELLRNQKPKELTMSDAEPTFEQKVINYLLAIISQSSNVAEQRKKPDFVPSRIRLIDNLSAYADPGEYDCEATVWGSIVLALPNAKRLGVYIHECEILAMVPNVKKQIMEKEAAEAAAESAS
jgi:hypothetical protein